MFEIEASKDCNRVLTRSHVFIGRRRQEADCKEMVVKQGPAEQFKSTYPDAVYRISISFVDSMSRSDVPCLWWRPLSFGDAAVLGLVPTNN